MKEQLHKQAERFSSIVKLKVNNKNMSFVPSQSELCLLSRSEVMARMDSSGRLRSGPFCLALSTVRAAMMEALLALGWSLCSCAVSVQTLPMVPQVCDTKVCLASRDMNTSAPLLEEEVVGGARSWRKESS